jgi:hypothetical protein
MTGQRLSMRKIRDVRRRKRGSGLINRAIARSCLAATGCNIAQSTVRAYLRRAKAAAYARRPPSKT